MSLCLFQVSLNFEARELVEWLLMIFSHPACGSAEKVPLPSGCLLFPQGTQSKQNAIIIPSQGIFFQILFQRNTLNHKLHLILVKGVF